MHAENRTELINRYARGFAAVVGALENFPHEMLTRHFIQGKWSAAEIVQHLADSEMTSAIRLRKLLSEDFPVIAGYDQDVYAQKMRYNTRDIAPALLAFRAARETSLQLLEQLDEADWKRSGWHTEHGVYTVEMWLEIYAAHAPGHAAQIARLRQLAVNN